MVQTPTPHTLTRDATHDARLQSWVDSANSGNSVFPIQNLPHGVARSKGSAESFTGTVLPARGAELKPRHGLTADQAKAFGGVSALVETALK